MRLGEQLHVGPGELVFVGPGANRRAAVDGAGTQSELDLICVCIALNVDVERAGVHVDQRHERRGEYLAQRRLVNECIGSPELGRRLDAA